MTTLSYIFDLSVINFHNLSLIPKYLFLLFLGSGLSQLQRMLSDLQRSIAVMNVRLVKQLKRRDRRQAKLQRNFDIVTAVLQASSLKRRE